MFTKFLNSGDRKKLNFVALAVLIFCSELSVAITRIAPASAEPPLSKRTGKEGPDGGTVSLTKDKYQIGEGERDRWTPKILKDPRNPANYVGRARDYMVLCEDDKALADFSKALQLDPINREALERRILLLGDMGKKEEALRDCNTLIKAYPLSTLGYENRCVVHQSMQKLKEALADTDAALKIFPRAVKAWQYRCSIYINQGDSPNAIKCLTKLTELDPTNATNFSVRANYYVKSKEYDKAISDLTQGIRFKPGEFEPFIMRADVYKEMKQYRKAIADYSRAIEMNKFRAGRAYKGRAECYKALGDTVSAERDLKQSQSGDSVFR